MKIILEGMTDAEDLYDAEDRYDRLSRSDAVREIVKAVLITDVLDVITSGPPFGLTLALKRRNLIYLILGNNRRRLGLLPEGAWQHPRLFDWNQEVAKLRLQHPSKSLRFYAAYCKLALYWLCVWQLQKDFDKYKDLVIID